MTWGSIRPVPMRRPPTAAAPTLPTGGGWSGEDTPSCGGRLQGRGAWGWGCTPQVCRRDGPPVDVTLGHKVASAWGSIHTGSPADSVQTACTPWCRWWGCCASGRENLCCSLPKQPSASVSPLCWREQVELPVCTLCSQLPLSSHTPRPHLLWTFPLECPAAPWGTLRPPRGA